MVTALWLTKLHCVTWRAHRSCPCPHSGVKELALRSSISWMWASENHARFQRLHNVPVIPAVFLLQVQFCSTTFQWGGVENEENFSLIWLQSKCRICCTPDNARESWGVKPSTHTSTWALRKDIIPHSLRSYDFLFFISIFNSSYPRGRTIQEGGTILPNQVNGVNVHYRNFPQRPPSYSWKAAINRHSPGVFESLASRSSPWSFYQSRTLTQS